MQFVISNSNEYINLSDFSFRSETIDNFNYVVYYCPKLCETSSTSSHWNNILGNPIFVIPDYFYYFDKWLLHISLLSVDDLKLTNEVLFTNYINNIKIKKYDMNNDNHKKEAGQPFVDFLLDNSQFATLPDLNMSNDVYIELK